MKLDRRVDLGTAGIEFVRRQVSKTLGGKLRSLPLEEGQVQTWLPDYIEEDRVFAFESGDLHLRCEEGDYVEAFHEEDLEDAPTIEALDEGAYRVVCEYLREDARHCFLLKTTLSPAQLKRSRLAHVFHGTETFLTFTGLEFKEYGSTAAAFDHLDQIFHNGTGVGFLCRESAKPSETLDHLLVEAYRGEAWLVWNPTQKLVTQAAGH